MKFLIYGGPGIGDTVIELALAAGLKEAFPGCQVALAVNGSQGTGQVLSQLLACQKAVDKLYLLDKKRPLNLAGTLLALRYQRFSFGFSCTSRFKASPTPARILRLLGCRSIVKDVPGKTGRADHPVTVPETLPMVCQYGQLFQVLVPKGTLPFPVLEVPEPLSPKLLAVPRVILCPGTNTTTFPQGRKQIPKNIKAWPFAYWCRLADALAAEGYSVVFLGGPAERDLLTQAAPTDARVDLTLLGNTTIAQSLSVLHQSQLVIGGDTGMMHCAGALGRKTLTLFGGTDPQVWQPFSPDSHVLVGHAPCAPCYGDPIALGCTHRRCMEAITPEQVLAKAKELLT